MIFSSIGLSRLARDQRLELPLELGDLVAVSPDAATELVERALEPLPLLGDEQQEAVPFGVELTDLLLELLLRPTGLLRLARQLSRRDSRSALAVLLELRARCGELELRARR